MKCRICGGLADDAGLHRCYVTNETVSVSSSPELFQVDAAVCPRCGSGESLTSYGMAIEGLQRWRCAYCNRWWDAHPSVQGAAGMRQATRELLHGDELKRMADARKQR